MRRALLSAAALCALAGCGSGAKAPGRTTSGAASERQATTATSVNGNDPRVLDRLMRANRRRSKQKQSSVTPSAAPSPPRAQVPRPSIVQRPIPFGARRRAEMASYAQRHYGFSSARLRNPHVIVEHVTASSTFASAYNTFAADTPDVELHELPGVCSHFIVDTDGTIYQLVPTSLMCRHTVGLNWTAIGIEHVGISDAQVMGDARQLAASIALTRWLRCRYGIGVANVIGHNESLSSPYHHENVARLRNQTHGDMAPASMRVYRARLRAAGPCTGG